MKTPFKNVTESSVRHINVTDFAKQRKSCDTSKMLPQNFVTGELTDAEKYDIM